MTVVYSRQVMPALRTALVLVLLGSSSLVASASTRKDAARRRSEAKKALGVLRSVADPQQRGRLAAMSFAESGLGLPVSHLNVLKAMAEVDPSACATLLASSFGETAMAEKRCGRPFSEVAKRVRAAAPTAQTEVLMSTCKIVDAPEKPPSKLDPWALLLSAIVADELAADPASNAEEKQLAKLVSYACPPPR
jgi:hypothetical protein